MAYQAYAALDSILKASLAKKRADVDKSLKMIQMGMEKMKLDEAIASSKLNQSLAELKIQQASGELKEWNANTANRKLLADYNIKAVKRKDQREIIEDRDKAEDEFLEEMTKLQEQNLTNALQFSNSFSGAFGLSPITTPDDADQKTWVEDAVGRLSDEYKIDEDDPFLQRLVSSAWVSRVGSDHVSNFDLINDLRLSVARSNAGIANDLDKQLMANFNKLGVVDKRPTEDKLGEELFINPNYQGLISNVASVTENLTNVGSEIDDFWASQREDITFDTKSQMNEIDFQSISDTLDLLKQMKDNNARQRVSDEIVRKEQELMQQKIEEERLRMIASGDWDEFDVEDIEKTYTNELDAIDTLNTDINISKEQIDEINSAIAAIQSENTSLKAAKDYGYEVVNYDGRLDSNDTQLDSLYNQLGSTQAILDTDVEELDKREEVVEIMSTRQKAINRLKRKNLDLTEANIKKEEDKVKNEEKALELVSKNVEPHGRVSGTSIKLLNKPLGQTGATPGEIPEPYFPEYTSEPIETPTISQDEIRKFVRHPDLLGYP